MRILLANYRYYASGGPERYMFNLSEALEARGHEVVPFSIRYSANVPSPYARYFADPLAGADAVRFRDHPRTPRSVLKTLERAFYSPEVERAVGRLIDDTSPQVAYVLHYLKKLSPSLLVGIKKRGLPLVVRISDFLMVCPQALFLRDGKPCTLCARGNLWPSLRYRCVAGSLGASVVHFLSWHYQRWRGYFDLIDRFVVSNEFMLEKMVEGGWPRDKMALIPTPVSPAFLADAAVAAKAEPSYILYVGHMEPHKGTDVLLRAYGRLARQGAPPKLVLVGKCDTPFGTECRRLAEELGLGPRAEFRGPMDGEPLRALYRGALFTVFPSICYENMPNVVIESLASGTAVVASSHGSIAPLIRDGETGLLFAPGDDEALADAMGKGLQPGWSEQAGRAARSDAARYALDRHLEQLLRLFGELPVEGRG